MACAVELSTQLLNHAFSHSHLSSHFPRFQRYYYSLFSLFSLYWPNAVSLSRFPNPVCAPPLEALYSTHIVGDKPVLVSDPFSFSYIQNSKRCLRRSHCCSFNYRTGSGFYSFCTLPSVTWLLLPKIAVRWSSS